jgi:hypothetical protein
VDGEAVAFLGNCGYGKSTLAAAMLARGFPVLTDDLIVLDADGPSWRVQAGVPRLKLFPSIARRLLGSDAGGTPMNPDTSKLVVPLTGARTVRQPVPLKAVYVLPGPGAPGRASTRVNIQPLCGSEAFIEVIRAAFNLIVTDRKRLSTQFAFAKRVASSVPLRRLRYPRKLSALPALCDALLADLRSLPSRA